MGINVIYVLVCSLGLLPYLSDGACSFPTDLRTGTWQSSDMGEVTFNETHFTASRIVSFGSMTFTCVQQSGWMYYSVSDQFSFLQDTFKVAICFTLDSLSTTKFLYYLHSPVLANTDFNRVIFDQSSYSFSWSETCSVGGFTFSQLRLLINEAYVNESTVTCENNLLSQFSYNISGVTCSNSLMDTCADNTQLAFNYSYCSYPMLYSSGGLLNCVYTYGSGDTTYTIVYNNDTTVDYSSTYRYTCMAVSTSVNTTYMTSYPGMCLDGQNSSAIKSPGLAVHFQAIENQTCTVSTDDDDSSVLSAGAVSAVILAIVILLVAGIIMGAFYYIRVYRIKKINPDSEGLIPSKSPPIGTQEEKKPDGRVSPFSPLPTVSELALYRYGQEIDDDDGGMTLEATTPGFTDGRRTLFDKDVDRESQVSLPVYSEPGGETPDPTRLSEVQTRMSEVSEQNIGDPTPWTMTRATMNIPEESSVSPIQTPIGIKPNESANMSS